MLSPSASCPEPCVNWAVKLNYLKKKVKPIFFFSLALVFLIWINSLICLTVQSCCYKPGIAAKSFDLYIYHLSSFESGHRGGYSFMDFNARMISSNHLAWPAILSHEFHPVVLPWSSVTSGWFVAKRVELYPAFIWWFQEITWYLFTFDFTSPEFWSTAEKASGNFPSVCPTIFWFFKLCSALYNTWSSCFLSAHLVSSIFCHFSKCCGCCSFSWAILHLFGGFFPTEWRLNLEAFQNRATCWFRENVCLWALYSLCKVAREILDTAVCNDTRG